MSKPIKYDRDEIVRLTRLGLSATEISVRLGCSTRQVQRVRSARKVSGPTPEGAGRRITPERLAAIERMIEDGVAHAEIMRTLRVGHHTLARHFPGTAWSPQEAGEYARAIRRSYERQRRAA